MVDLLALTLICPWAFCVSDLGKPIENRGWRFPRALIGKRIAIHAGKAPPLRKDGLAGDAWDKVLDTLTDVEIAGLVPPDFKRVSSWLISPRQLTEKSSAIVALVTLGEPVTESESKWFSGPYGWPLLERFTLPEPVPCRGAQGLWKVPPEIAARVLAQESR